MYVSKRNKMDAVEAKAIKRTLKKHPEPVAMVTSSYQAQVDPDE